MRGFGMSDVLLGRSGEPRGLPRRWSNVAIAPIGGTVPRDGEVALLWENYAFGERDGAANYGITVTVQREHAQLLNRIGARVMMGAATLLGIDRSVDRVVFRFDRTVPHAQIMVEHVAVSMDGAPPGTYRLTVNVADAVTGRSAARTVRIVIPE
jgi:hypothetical protein